MNAYVFRWLRLVALLTTSLLWGCYQDSPLIEPAQQLEPQSDAVSYYHLLSVPHANSSVAFEGALGAVAEQNQSSLRALGVRQVLSSSVLRTKDGLPALYVLNYSPEGYAIVSVTRKYTPILAHSTNGSIYMFDNFLLYNRDRKYLLAKPNKK